MTEDATTGKGRPTPKRSEKQRRRTGPVAPPPKTGSSTDWTMSTLLPSYVRLWKWTL